MKKVLMISLIALAFPGFILNSASVWAQGRTDRIAERDKPAPDGNGSFANFGLPVLDNSGHVAFSAFLDDTIGGTDDNEGIFRGNGEIVNQIARKHQSAPTDGRFAGFASPLINNSGQTTFFAGLSGTANDQGIFVGSGGTITQIFLKGQLTPDNNGTYSGFGQIAFNDSGQVATVGFLTGTSGVTSDNQGIFRGNGAVTTQIARKGQNAPGNGRYLTFGGPQINNSGQVAFWSGLSNTTGGNSDNFGIYRGSGGVVTQIARKGQAAPDANGVFSGFNSSIAFNDWGQVAFSANLTNTIGGANDNQGVYRGSGGTLTQIARTGQAAPDETSTFTGFDSPALNKWGQVAFLANLSEINISGNNSSGIYVGSGDGNMQIARTGQSAPDGNGILEDFGNPVLNDSGQSVFLATLTGTSGGNNDNSGIFTGDGTDFLKVIRRGDSLAGSTVANFSLATGNYLNDHGQVAYKAELSNGNEIVSRWTPDLHWRLAFDSAWENNNGWTLGLKPAHVHDVVIDSAASLKVTGPTTNTTVRSLQIGGGTGLATLDLGSGAVLTATNGVTVASTGTLTGDGSIAGNVINNGNILADNITVVGTLTNHSVIEGHGRIHANIFNSASGEIRALAGNTMRLTGASLSNSGLVEVHGGELRVSSTLQNSSGTGLVSMRSGSLIVSSGITNAGSFAFSQGASTLRGDVNNTGTIQVSGGADATFFDDVVQNGTMQVAAIGNSRSSAVILGSFSGNGGFVGGGDVFALGDLRPGNSPGVVTYGGNLFMGTSTETFIELGGLRPGLFDQMRVLGDLSLNGSLNVSLINGFHLSLNQKFFVGDITGNRIGQFLGLGEGARVGNFGEFDLMISYLGGNGNDITLFTSLAKNNTPYLTGDGSLSAVPEPSSLLLVGIAAIGGFGRRRRT